MISMRNVVWAASCGAAIAVDTHQAVPEAGRRDQLHAVYQRPGVFEKLIECPADELDQIVRVQFFNVAKGGEDAIGMRLRAHDRLSLFIEERGSDT